MRLGIDDVLSAHGIGQGPGPFFGNGSDGAFNPAAPAPVSVNSNITFGINGGYYAGSSATTYPSTFYSSTTVPSLGLVLDTGTINNGQPATQYDVKPDYTATNTSYNYMQTGVMFSSSQSVNVKGIWIGTSGMNTNYQVQVNLWDTTTQTLVASSTGTNYAQSAGWNQINFSSIVSLVAGRNYMIGICVSGSSNVFNAYYYNPVNPTVNAAYTYNSQGTYTFSTTQDGVAVVKQFTSVNIPANLTVNVSNRCQGMIWLVEGDVTINGEVCMDYLGAILDPTQNPGFAVATKVQQLCCPIGNNKFIIVGPGGAGAAGGVGGGVAGAGKGGSPGQPTGGTWYGGGLGGGGGGGGSTAAGDDGGAGGNAGFGTSSGGAALSSTSSLNKPGNPGSNGGGGSGAAGNAGSSSITSGAGGIALGGGGGGGGSVSTSASSPTTAGSGGSSTQAPGGLILIIAKGNVTIGSGAIISAKGGNGGNGGNAAGNNSGGAGGGGGAAGGGIVAILYKGTYTNNGTINVPGGIGGTAGTASGAGTQTPFPAQPGGNGTPGVVQVVKVA